MSGRIPQSFINDLLTRIDIVDIIDGRVALKKAGRNYQGLCPFHTEKTPSFSVAPDKQFYHCFGCGASGTALTFLMEFDRLEFVEAVEALARSAGVEVPREGGPRRQQDHADLYTVLGRAEQFFRQALKQEPDAIDYLQNRGVAGLVARDFGIGFAPESWDALRKALADVPEATLLEAGLLTRNDSGRVYDRFRGRVMFPIRDTRGRVIGFGGRVMGKSDGPKYLNSPETPVFHKGRELYGLYEARKALRRIDRLIVVEGYMDAVALAQAGIPNAVATLGTAATPEHFQKLYRYTEEVICCFDGDNAGRQAAWRALESALPQLGEGHQLKFMFLPEGEDPDSLVRAQGKDAFLRLAAAALPSIEYLFDRLGDGLDLRSLDDRARLASLALPHIERVPNGILKDLMLGRLEQVTGLNASRSLRGRGLPAPGGAGSPVSTRSPARPMAAGASGTPDSDNRLRPGGRLQERLLGYLLVNPVLLLALPPEQRALLCANPEPDLLAEVARYVGANPEVQPAEILGRWTGTAAYGELLRLLKIPQTLAAHALQGEFTDGVTKLLETQARNERRRMLSEIRVAPTREKLMEYWARRQGDSGAAAAGGNGSEPG
jgi:DNA primase